MSTDTIDLETLRARVKESFYFFAKGILGYDWLTPEIHLPVCLMLQDRAIKRKLIELPRGWLKSTLASVSYPIWRAIHNPNIRILIVQNTSTNAAKKLAVIRRQWETNNLLRLLYPTLLPTKESTWTRDSVCLTRTAAYAESTFESAGTSTAVVSRHYDLIIEDDTVAPDLDELGNETLAPTHQDVTQAIGWHRTNVLPLLNNPTEDESIVVGTRWYDEDLIRWVKDNEKQYVVHSRAVREDSEGKPDPKGVVTYPQRFGELVLHELEVALGPYMYSCLYMNTPVRADDMLFKSEWIKYYQTLPSMGNMMVYTTVDPATDPSLSASKDTDYSVVMTCGKDMQSGNIYVIDYFRQRCNPGELAAAVFDHVHRFKPIVVGYEAIQFQKSLDYWLKEMMRQNNLFFVLEPLSRHGRDAKKAAITGLQPLFASGTIYLREYMKDLVSELTKYPLGKHDDLPDALSMQLRFWRMTKSQSQRKSKTVVDPFSLDSVFNARAEKQKAESLSKNFGRFVFNPKGSYGLPRSFAN